MKPSFKPHVGILLALFSLTTVVAYSDTFDFSYTFSNVYGSPGSAAGTLLGTQVGDSVSGFVTDVTVESLFINGAEVMGAIHAYDVQNFWSPHGAEGSAIVSFELTQSRFMFVNNSDYDNGFYPYLGRFTVDVAGNYGAYATNHDQINDSSAGDRGDGEWSLIKRKVPDRGATVILLGIALSGLVVVRYKLGPSTNVLES